MNPCGIHITDHKDSTDYQEHVYENDLACFISHVIFTTLASSNQFVANLLDKNRSHDEDQVHSRV